MPRPDDPLSSTPPPRGPSEPPLEASTSPLASDPPRARASAPSGVGRKIVFGVLIGVVVYGVIVVVGGANKIEQELARFSFGALGMALCLALVNYGIRFLKWEYYLKILDVRGIPKGESFLTFLSGFVLTITPGKVGEMFKSYVLEETRGIPMVRTAPIVIAERLTDLIGIIVLIAVGSASFPGGAVWAAIGAAVVGTLLVMVTVPSLTRALLKPLPTLPGVFGRVGGRIVPKVDRALVELRELTAPSRLIYPSLLSIAGWAIEGIGVWFILRGFGEKPELLQSSFFYATATLAGALVPVPGGLGVTEKVLEQSMVRLGGVPAAVATATMLLGRLATLWFAVLLGFIALALLRIRYPRLLSSTPQGGPQGPSERPPPS